jgi:hypothetical protein
LPKSLLLLAVNKVILAGQDMGNVMTIEKFKIYGSREPASRASFDDHLVTASEPFNSWREFRTEEIVPVATYAAQYFLDATQGLLHAHMRDGEVGPIDIELASGWRVRSLDLGLHWKRHVELIDSNEPERGFIVEGQLERVERRDRPLTVADILGSFAARDDDSLGVVANNKVTAKFDPSDSARFDQIVVYPFHPDEGGYCDHDTIVRRLSDGQSVRESISHKPHEIIDAETLAARPSSLRDSLSEFPILMNFSRANPGEILAALPVMAEFLSTVDPSGLAAAYDTHIDTVHVFIDRKLTDLISATRSCLGTSASGHQFPPAPLLAMIEELWSRSACADILHFGDEVEAAAARLAELGHVSADETFECNDGRTRVYASTDGETSKVFVDRDTFGVCISQRNDRIVVSTGDYGLGSEEKVLLDFTAEDGVVTSVAQIVSYSDLSAGILRRALLSVSSVYSEIVPKPGPPDQWSPQMP